MKEFFSSLLGLWLHSKVHAFFGFFFAPLNGLSIVGPAPIGQGRSGWAEF